MNRRIMPASIALLLAVSALLIAPPRADDAFAHVSETGGEKLFFALSIADERGMVLAEPKLLGKGGIPLEMTLRRPDALSLPGMSLLLEPEWQRDGSYEIAFELTVPGLLSRGKGSLRLRPGEEKSAQLDYPGGFVEVQLTAFAVPSPALDLYLQHGIQAAERASRT